VSRDELLRARLLALPDDERLSPAHRAALRGKVARVVGAFDRGEAAPRDAVRACVRALDLLDERAER
jgi:hypothetical protein